MDLKLLAAMLIRLLGFYFLYEAFDTATYFPTYIERLMFAHSVSPKLPSYDLSFIMLGVREAFHAIAGIALVYRCRQLAGALVRSLGEV